jgi:hypothetical protein
LQNGFAPNVTAQVESQLLPALDRSFARGSESILEQASQSGLINSSGTVQSVGDLRGGLEANLMQQLAGITGQGALQGQQIQAGLSQQGLAQLMQSVGAFQMPISSSLQESQFARQLPLSALNSVAGGASNAPLYQPSYGKSQGQGLLAGGGAVAGGFFGGGPAGAAVGGQAGNAIGGALSK